MTTNLNTLTVAEVAGRTNLSRRSVYALVASGELKHVRAAGRNSRIRILESSLEDFFVRAIEHTLVIRQRERDADAELPPCKERAFL